MRSCLKHIFKSCLISLHCPKNRAIIPRAWHSSNAWIRCPHSVCVRERDVSGKECVRMCGKWQTLTLLLALDQVLCAGVRELTFMTVTQ